ncbi:Protoheme IX farnesyltransferase [Microbacterium oxydans]|uniref:Protoheme IX farnesyltransferase n=1 Tax=Microbacterium oxydans TaxID=82380 RepID=A0A0F0KHV3_9MICO|nr:heme o synthase [Microbacterium oxydans]KJL20487.1 Protoheme IX farnesyltransferase [Microbacterium oxydans]
MLRTVRAYLELTKPRILELLLVTTIPVMVFAADGQPSVALMAAVLVGGALSAGSAGAFNMYLERGSDALMERTAQRPLVTGVVSARAGLIFALVLGVSSVGWMLALVGPLPAALSTAGLLLYVVFYTVLLKPRTEQNIVWGGVAGCMPVLVGWSAVRGAVEWPAVVLFLVVFFWTPAHYWPLSIRYRDDYRRAGVPMLGATRPPVYVAPRVIGFAVATVVCSLVLPFVAEVSWLYWTVALGAGIGFVVSAWRMRSRARRDAELRPMLVFRASIAYLAVLFLAVGVDPLLTP